MCGEDVTACFGKRVQLEPTLMQISARGHIAAGSRRGVTGAAG